MALFAAGIPENNTEHQENQKIPENNRTNVTISPEEAQEIAAKFVKETGAQVGTPQLSEIEGQLVYTVPVISNGTSIGEITISAITGKNMGGAGGVL